MIIKVLFYVWAIFALLLELQLMTKPKKFMDFKAKMKGVKFDNLSDQQKAFGVLTLLYVFWVFVGLLSSQWALFLIYIVIGIPFSLFKKSMIIKSIDGFISSCLLVFIIVNAFHLHINVYEFIINLF